MLANYGYKDGSGEYFITIDTDRCDGCGDCAGVCPSGVFVVVEEDPYDPLRDAPVAIVGEAQRNKLKYACAQCKPAGESPPLPCVKACRPGAVTHSW
jgi:ferredoxin